MDTPTSTESRPAVVSALKTPADLTEIQRAMCDDIIALVIEKKGGLPPDEETLPALRDALWRRVFDNWDTHSFYRHPGRNYKLHGHQSSFICGTLREDDPPSETAAQQAARRSTAAATRRAITPVHRRKGARVLLKLKVHRHEAGINFMLVDTEGAIVKPGFVEYRAGLTHVKARAEAIVRWDRNEKKRVGDRNLALGVYWARRRLLRHMRLFPRTIVQRTPAEGEPECEGDLRQVIPDESGRQENLSELQKPRRLGEIMDMLSEVAEHTLRLTRHRPRDYVKW